MGTGNLAARRGAKANRRKAIVAQKRKAEAAEASLAGQIARASTLPIRLCLLNDSLFEVGIGTLVLLRGGRVGASTAAVFLIDVWCRGVKDIIVRTLEEDELEIYLDRLSEAVPVDEVEPEYGRKLLGELVRWSASLGLPPHRNFALAERLFGDVDANACEISFEFGAAGKPLYMSGPKDAPSTARRETAQLRERLGADGFDYIVPAV